MGELIWVLGRKDARRATWTLGQMYARFDGCTVLSVVQIYSGGPLDVRSINRTLDVRYFLEYPLDNTWTYEVALGPLCKSAKRTPLGQMLAAFLGL